MTTGDPRHFCSAARGSSLCNDFILTFHFFGAVQEAWCDVFVSWVAWKNAAWIERFYFCKCAVWLHFAKSEFRRTLAWRCLDSKFCCILSTNGRLTVVCFSGFFIFQMHSALFSCSERTQWKNTLISFSCYKAIFGCLWSEVVIKLFSLLWRWPVGRDISNWKLQRTSPTYSDSFRAIFVDSNTKAFFSYVSFLFD